MGYCLTCMGRGLTQKDMYHPAYACVHCKGSGIEKETPMGKDIIVIIFTGKKLSGKTTSAKYLVEKYDYMRLRFANTLKDMLYAFGLSEAEVDGELKELPCEKLGGKTPVYAMQTLGTEWGRDLIDPNIWVKALDRELEHMIKNGLKRFVIDDLRFINESLYLDLLREKYKVLVVGVTRKGTNIGEHRSETEMDQIITDWNIGNSESLEYLHRRLDNMVFLNIIEEKVKEK